MTKKCKFDVEVTYNSDYFAEGEIRDTIKKAIKYLNDQNKAKLEKKGIWSGVFIFPEEWRRKNK